MLCVILCTVYKGWFSGGRCQSADVCEYLHYSMEQCSLCLQNLCHLTGAPQFIVGQLSDDPSHEIKLHAGVILGVMEKQFVHNSWKRRAVNYRGIVNLRAVLNWLPIRYADWVFISSYQASALLGKILEHLCLSVDQMQEYTGCPGQRYTKIHAFVLVPESFMKFIFSTVCRVTQRDFYALPYASIWAPFVARQISKRY